MAQEKRSFEQFLEAVEADYKAFAQSLHDYMQNNGCKATFEEKKTSVLGSYKHVKSKKSVVNLLAKKYGLVVRIYGENISAYPDFLNTLTEDMVESIEKAGECKRLVHNTCSPKCTGYDFVIGSEHFQKCRYNCFEFLATKENENKIKAFVESELKERNVAS